MKTFKTAIMSLSLFMISGFAQAACVTVGGYPAALSEEILDKAVQFVVQKDKVAFQKLYDAGLVISLKDDVPVHVMDTTFSGKVQIRPQGSTASVWTLFEAVKCK